MEPSELIEITRAYVDKISSGASDEDLDRFYAPDIVQEEFPNAFFPQGARRNHSAIKEANAKGRSALSAQTLEIVNIVAMGNNVALEAHWTGTLAVPLGSHPPGTTLCAHFAQFLEFKDGLIWRQRSYDCYDPL